MEFQQEVEAGKAPKNLFDHIIKKYFRRIPFIPLPIYLSVVQDLSAVNRRKVARFCHFPEVIEFLAEDPDPSVRDAAFENEYWILLGQYKQLINLPPKEKLDFIQREGFSNIIIFLVFETDLKVLEALYHHPGISIYMLNTLRHYYQDRIEETGVRSHLELIQSVISIRKKRILLVSEILKEAKVGNPARSIPRLFRFLLNEDTVVVQSAVNLLKKFDYALLREHIFKQNPFGNNGLDSEKIWPLIENLKQFYRLSNRPLLELSQSPLKISHTQQSFLNDIQQRKIMLLEYCGANLDKMQNVITLAYAHLDPGEKTQAKLREILSLDELLSLVSDKSFPKATGRRVLKILKQYPASSVQKRISEIHLEIFDRTRQRLREMEMSINAYFDIIFNSLGYPRIYQIRQAFKILESAKKLTGGFIDQNDVRYMEFDRVYELFGKISEFYQGKLMDIYLDMAKNRIHELRELYEVILMVMAIPEKFVQADGYSVKQNSAIYQKELNSANTIWRATIGQYLGRLHEMDEMIRRKWLFTIEDTKQKRLMKREMDFAIRNMERTYKKEVGCKLSLSCKDCQKRPCASERYLRQVEFFLGELLEFVELGEKEGIRVSNTVHSQLPSAAIPG
jgi:hypothetical protein